MEEVRISDVTMKALGGGLSFREKLELSKLLDRLGASVIELEGIASAKVDALRIKSVALAVKDSVVAVPAALSREGVDAAWSALKDARRPRLQIVTPTSTVQMEYICHKKPDAMLALIRELVAYCREKCADVEFVADDATRADADYLKSALCAAVEALPNVTAELWTGLLADYARERGAGWLVKGARSGTDFDSEFAMAQINRSLDAGLDTVLLPARAELLHLSSTMVREMIKYGRPLEPYVPAEAIRLMKGWGSDGKP